MSSTTRREFITEAKVISEEKGIIEYVASSQQLDGHCEIVVQSGWKFDRFTKNAPFVNSHNYWSIEDQLGKVISAEVQGDKLIERVQWAIDVEECKLAKLGFNMTAKGYLKAVSVGFIPESYVCRGSEDFAKECERMKLPADVIVKLRCIYLKQQQIELSACVIGSCPDALARAFNEGAVKEEELAAVGLGGDRELGFLLDAGAKWALLDPEARYRTSGALDGIVSRHLKVSKGKTPPATSPGKPDGGDEAARLAGEELEEIQRRLNDLTAQRAKIIG